MPVDFKGLFFCPEAKILRGNFILSAGPLIEPGAADFAWQLLKPIRTWYSVESVLVTDLPRRYTLLGNSSYLMVMVLK